VGPCIDPDALERYALGHTSASETAALEEHLLVCPDCQNRLRVRRTTSGPCGRRSRASAANLNR